MVYSMGEHEQWQIQSLAYFHFFEALRQGSTLAVARWPGATRNWCRATKLSKKLHFGGPIGQLKISRWWCDENNIIRSPNITAIHFDRKSKTPDIYFSVIRSRILPSFISDRKSKHPTFMLASYGAEYYRHSFSDRKSKHPTFILASYGAQYYRHSFPTVRANTQHLF